MHKLTLQLYLHGNWHDAMQLSFDTPEAGLASPSSFGYLAEYLASHLDNLGCYTSQAVSATLPLAWDVSRAPNPGLCSRLASSRRGAAVFARAPCDTCW